MVDVGMLLRAMLDACFQAEYMVGDPDKAVERADDYLDFEYVDRFKLVERIFRYDNELARKMKQSPKRAKGEEGLKSGYERVKHRYPKGKITKGKTKVRDKWYTGQREHSAFVGGIDLEKYLRIVDKGGPISPFWRKGVPPCPMSRTTIRRRSRE